MSAEIKEMAGGRMAYCLQGIVNGQRVFFAALDDRDEQGRVVTEPMYTEYLAAALMVSELDQIMKLAQLVNAAITDPEKLFIPRRVGLGAVV